MRSITHGVLAAVLVAGVPALAVAHDGPAYPAYPLSITDGENTRIIAAPGTEVGTLVGGGRVVTRQDGNNTDTRHLDANMVQQQPPGMIAMSIGSGEDSRVVFVPIERAGARGMGPRG